MDRKGDEMGRLIEERRALANQKREITKKIRNEEKKRQRIMRKSAQLTSQDMLEVIAIREHRLRLKQEKKEAAEAGEESGEGGGAEKQTA